MAGSDTIIYRHRDRTSIVKVKRAQLAEQSGREQADILPPTRIDIIPLTMFILVCIINTFLTRSKVK